MADGVPPEQQYFIVNKVRASDGSRLFVTYKGEGEPLAVEKQGDTIAQLWYISGKAGEPQNISSAKNIHIKAVPSGLPGGKEFVIPKEDRYGWQISGDPKEVVIYTTDYKKVWGITAEVVPGEPVILDPVGIVPVPEQDRWEFVQLTV